MYTIGPTYAHAEARKSPTLDGKVIRDGKGKVRLTCCDVLSNDQELRCPVSLSAEEKEIARKASLVVLLCVFMHVDR